MCLLGDARTALWGCLATSVALGITATTAARHASASAADDRKTVATLDKRYQVAVETKDAVAIARILADDFVLVTGCGKTYTKADMLTDAHGSTVYEKNDEDSQIVRVWGNPAVVPARLWEKGTANGMRFDHELVQ